MNERLINQIRDLIQKLEQERAKLQEGTTAFNQKSKAIKSFQTSLKKMTGEAATSAKELQNLNNQMAKFFSDYQRGMMQGRYRFGQQGRFPTETLISQADLDNRTRSTGPMAGAEQARAAGRDVNDQVNVDAAQAKATAEAKIAAEEKRILEERKKRRLAREAELKKNND